MINDDNDHEGIDNHQEVINENQLFQYYTYLFWVVRRYDEITKNTIVGIKNVVLNAE